MENAPIQESKNLKARIISGSVVLLSGSGLATAISFAYNVAVARLLGPGAFGNATAVYTLLIIISAVTLSFQIVSAKIVAQQSTLEGKYAVYRDFHRASWVCGILVGSLLIAFRAGISQYLNLPGPVLVELLAMGAAFYVPLGTRRGYIQGACGFQRLAKNLVLEGVIRLCGSLLLVLLGLGVRGVIAANAAAVAGTWFAAAPIVANRIPSPLRSGYMLRESLQAMVFFAGQVLINNCGIVLVKHFFLLREAGLYAAVAMVGRVIFTFAQAVPNSMFPLVAGTSEEERKNLEVITTSLLLVLGIGGVLALALRLAPAGIWTAFFGAEFAIPGPYGLPYLMSLFAVTTVLYSLSVVLITYEMSYKIANTSWVQLAFSGIVIAGICRFHSSLREVIWVQLVLMITLFVVVALPFLINPLTSTDSLGLEAEPGALRILRRVSEDEVIAEFLKSDFHNPAFRDYQETLHGLVASPDTTDDTENAKRRALLFLRHRSLWKELPNDTAWYELEMRPSDLVQVRVFPRAHWRKLGDGSFAILKIAEQVRKDLATVEDAFTAKIESIQRRIQTEDASLGAVILIGVNAGEPVTALDGNHRLVAAMLTGPGGLTRLRFLCGLSPRMEECCWYNTNLTTLFRYGKNVVRHIARDPEAELMRLLQMQG